jgi:hypothetical protein
VNVDANWRSSANNTTLSEPPSKTNKRTAVYSFVLWHRLLRGLHGDDFLERRCRKEPLAGYISNIASKFI